MIVYPFSPSSSSAFNNQTSAGKPPPLISQLGREHLFVSRSQNIFSGIPEYLSLWFLEYDLPRVRSESQHRDQLHFQCVFITVAMVLSFLAILAGP